MRFSKGILAIIAVVGLALALLLPSMTGATEDRVTLSIEAPAEVAQASEFTARMGVDHVLDFNSCNFDVTYDPAVITVTAVTGGEIDGHAVGVGPGYWTYMPPGSQDTGRIRVIATVPGVPGPGVTGAGYVAEIRFKVVGGGGDVSDLAISSVAMYDYQAAALATTTVDGSVTIAGPATGLEITTASPLPTGNADQGYSKTLAAAGGTPPYSWTASGLPDGLTCSEDGVISGTPAESGDFIVTVTVTDSAAASESKTLELKVEVEAALEITTTELPDADLGQGYTATLEAVGGAPPYTWQATGLPDGLTCSEDGVISGAPTESGDFTVTVTATDSAAASKNKVLAVEIHPTPEEPTIAFSPKSFDFSATEGEANPASQTLEIWNPGPGTLDWSVSSGAPWLSLSTASGSSTGERDSITVSVDIAGLTAGDYSSGIVIEAPGAANAQRVASVSLEIATASVPPDNDNDNDEPPGRSSMVVLWIALGAVVVVGATMLVLRRRKA